MNFITEDSLNSAYLDAANIIEAQLTTIIQKLEKQFETEDAHIPK